MRSYTRINVGNYRHLTGFYAPQGRTIRTSSVFKKAMDELHHQSFDGYPLTNFEMETAGIYALAALLGHEAYSFSALLANRAAGTFHDEPAQAVEFAYPQGARLGGGAGIKNPRLCTSAKPRNQ